MFEVVGPSFGQDLAMSYAISQMLRRASLRAFQKHCLSARKHSGESSADECSRLKRVKRSKTVFRRGSVKAGHQPGATIAGVLAKNSQKGFAAAIGHQLGPDRPCGQSSGSRRLFSRSSAKRVPAF
jgi:hypothetical protein